MLSKLTDIELAVLGRATYDKQHWSDEDVQICGMLGRVPEARGGDDRIVPPGLLGCADFLPDQRRGGQRR